MPRSKVALFARSAVYKGPVAIEQPTDATLRQAIVILEHGGLVALPTETVYGLGADALSASAVARIFEAKKRPLWDPLICHVADPSGVTPLVGSVSPIAEALASAFWPGPLTLVLPKHPRVPEIVTAGGPNVAVRVPDHPVARRLLSTWNGPIAAPSANLFGRTSPTTADHVDAQLKDAVDLILDGGPCRVGLESTIVDVSTSPPRLLRPGGVPAEAIETLLGEPLVVPETASLPGAAPGRADHHYAPLTPLYLTSSPKPQHAGRVGKLAFQSADREAFAAVEVLSSSGDLREAAYRLFGALRRLDADHLDAIEAEPVPEHGLGRAIMDRLRRAVHRRA